MDKDAEKDKRYGRISMLLAKNESGVQEPDEDRFRGVTDADTTINLRVDKDLLRAVQRRYNSAVEHALRERCSTDSMNRDYDRRQGRKR